MKDKLYKLMNWPEIEAIIYSEEDNPHRLLGPRQEGSSVLLQAFFPGAVNVFCRVSDPEKEIQMDLADEAGYFAALIPGKLPLSYVYEVEWADGTREEVDDPYAFEPVITREQTKLFNEGICYQAYEFLGAHIRRIEGIKGVHFAVWAPNAMRVSVVGDFNGWDGRFHQMRRLWDSGIFELFIPCAKEGQNYKYEIKVKGGLTYLKADPYAFGHQMRPDTASVIRNIGKFKWEDKDWIVARKKQKCNDRSMSVYEMYLGSFRKPDVEDGRTYYNYRELAPVIIEYVRDMGYTHIELMPVMEHPFDGSWGYQVIGYYAPTARYGTPEDFMFFMNEMHKAGIGVILDWVPAHFPRDTHGLSAFDGTYLYEHMDPRQGSHPHWGTLIYNYGRHEVCNYLIANAMYWIDKYHADGIRMDAVASMLYLDYGKNDGEWVANIYGGNENLEAIAFIRNVNHTIHKYGNGALSIAEESTSWPKVTGDIDDGGLGFDLKWNMGWMNDFLGYMQEDPYFRAGRHGALTFSLIYAYSEQFMLVLSHDEVVHGKGSLIGKMPGEYADKFANLRTAYTFMMGHPGKKLLFMGQDIAEFEEWNENREIKWELLAYESHRGINNLVRKLNRIYAEYPALTGKDDSADGFEWINCINASDCTLSFVRKTEKPEEMLLFVLNFANVERQNFQVGVPAAGKYKELLNTDASEFGGGGIVNGRMKTAKEEEYDGREHSITLNLAPLSASILTYRPFTREERKQIADKKKEKIGREKKVVQKRTASAAKTLKEEIAGKVAEADEAIFSGSEAVAREIKVTKEKIEEKMITKAAMVEPEGKKAKAPKRTVLTEKTQTESQAGKQVTRPSAKKKAAGKKQQE